MVASPSVGLVKPFRALRYDVREAGPLEDLVAPPYDVITPETRERLLGASPYNCVRLIRPYESAQAADTFRAWQEGRILVREERPAVWLVEDEFVGPDGVARTRRGLAARVRLHPYSDGIVLPHERTFPGPKEARLQLLRAVRAKLSPIFLLHDGPSPELDAARPPDLHATLVGATTRAWRVDDPTAIDAATAAIRGRLVIADGHHRYETALRFHEEEGGEETAFVMAVLVSRHDPGLVVYPTHRLVRGALPELDGRFRVTTVPGGAAEAAERLARVPRDRPAFVLVRREEALLAEVDPAPAGPVARLDTAAVDGLALENVGFTASVAEAERAVATGEAAAALLVRPPTIEQIEAVALSGERMPPKTTYFFPKLTSGLLFSPFDE